MSLKPPIGFPIHWFSHADRNRDPQAAFVLSHNGDLLVIETIDAQGRHQTRRDQRHMSDPVLAKNQQWRIDHGGWDYIPGMFVSIAAEPPVSLVPEPTPGSPEPTVVVPPKDYDELPDHLLYKEKEGEESPLPPMAKVMDEKPARAKAKIS